MPETTSKSKSAHPPPRAHLPEALAYANAPGDFPIRFGQHKGLRLGQVPDEYLRYVATSSWYPELRALAERVLDERALVADEGPLPELSGVPAAAVLPRLLFEWHEWMGAAFAGDAAALGVVERGLEELRRIAAELIDGPRAEGGECG